MRRFLLHRREDASGVSGIGYVAEGVQFGDGRVVLCWRPAVEGMRGSLGMYDNLAAVEAIHGHEGRTEVEWTDEGLPPSLIGSFVT